MILGIDIGTTTISAVIMEEDGKFQESKTVPNNSFIECENKLHHAQNPDKIYEIITELLDYFKRKYRLSKVGIACQMHGILYIDKYGRALSPFYTWQDESGNLEFQNGLTYCDYIEDRTGLKVSSGFGLVTHFYLLSNGRLPGHIDKICTIGDYIGMKLSGTPHVMIHTSNAASLGLYDVQNHVFHENALSSPSISIDTSLLPEITNDTTVIGTKDNIAYYTAIGDNQASFLGTVADRERELLINLGTGGQISCCINAFASLPQIETRPFLKDQYLLVYSSLCGGRAYAALEQFFRKVLFMAGIEFQKENLYDEMRCAVSGLKDDSPLQIKTAFCGTRETPSAKGEILNLSLDNFTPGHFILGVLTGMAEEFYEAYRAFSGIKNFTKIKVSGNTISKNPQLVSIIEKMYNLPVVISNQPEEAAYGAALFANLNQ